MRRDKAPQKRSYHTVAAATTTWDLSSPSNSFLNQTLWMVVNWKWHLALVMNLGRTRAGKSQKKLNFPMMTRQMNSHQKTQSWKINLALWKRQRPML